MLQQDLQMLNFSSVYCRILISISFFTDMKPTTQPTTQPTTPSNTCPQPSVTPGPCNYKLRLGTFLNDV